MSPLKNGQISDASRIERLIPTLRELANKRAKIVILSHFGRPDGKRDEQYSLRPVAKALAGLWGQPVAFVAHCIGPEAEAAIKALAAGEILVLENTRFHAEEETNDPLFAKELAAYVDIYINDAFSVSHRAHASTEGIVMHLPSAAGRQMQEEMEALMKALEKPERPLAAIVGGAKISTKLALLRNLSAKVDLLILGGGMANTFLAAKGFAIGKSLSEPDMYEIAREIMAKADAKGCQILLPKDVTVAASLTEGIETKCVPVSAIPPDQMVLDLGSASVKEIKESLALCKTVVWNGPLGRI